jgi:hypothetical protein
MEQLAAAAAAAAVVPKTDFVAAEVLSDAARTVDSGAAISVSDVRRISQNAFVSRNGMDPLAAVVEQSPKTVIESVQCRSSTARACLYPLVADIEPYAMCRRSHVIGTGTDADVCLSDIGHCNRTSVKHAVIFYDELSRQYELLNYSEFGTTVDGVLYSCDTSVTTVKPPPPRRSTSSSRQRRSSAARAVESVRRLIAQIPQSKDEQSSNCRRLQQESSIGDGQNDDDDGRRTPCNCDKRNTVNTVDSQSSRLGWEGSAMLHHGSIVEFGCLRFSFGIAQQEQQMTHF